jgi:nucleoside-diphosphate-sugar epimerase
MNAGSSASASRVVLGCRGFVGSVLMAARPTAIGIDGEGGRDPSRLREALHQASDTPVIVHAAGSVASGPPSEAAYLDSTRSLFEAVADVRPEATILTLGSIAEALPIESPYASLKRRQAMIAAEFADARGVRWRHLRLHSLLGPGLPATLAPAAMTIRLRRAIDEGSRRVEIADGEAIRDWLDVRDAARMVLALADRADFLESTDALEICSGVGRSVRSLAEALVAVSGAAIEVADSERAPRSDRSDGIRSVVGDPRPIRRWIGDEASPRFTFEQTVMELWRDVAVSRRDAVS